MIDSKTSFKDVFSEATENLIIRESDNNKWWNADGSRKTNYWWKYASKTKQGDAGENVVRNIFDLMFSSVYGNNVEVKIVNKGRGEYDVSVFIPFTNKTIKFEVKTATTDTSDSYQFNGLKKDIGYDYAFLLAVSPEDFYFKIESNQYLSDNMTTLMSKDVDGSFKYTLSQKKVILLTPENLYEELNMYSLLNK
jgi:hypothetical protein